MALTNDSNLAECMFRLRTHGITKKKEHMTRKADGDWYYEQLELGFNYRMNDIQAALGISQFKRIDNIVSRRHSIAQRYNKHLKDLPLTVPYLSPLSYSSFHLYVILLRDQSKHQQFFKNLRDKGIGVNLHYIPIYRQPYYSYNHNDYKNFPNSEYYYSSAITIPLFPTMSKQDQDKVVKAIKQSI
jgi:dTDP-4-amino-4,6-dideoxygalactose transaminase